MCISSEKVVEVRVNEASARLGVVTIGRIYANAEVVSKLITVNMLERTDEGRTEAGITNPEKYRWRT